MSPNDLSNFTILNQRKWYNEEDGALMDNEWSDLTKEQKAAVSTLGISQKDWDSNDFSKSS